jgi:hypothetical protein
MRGAAWMRWSNGAVFRIPSGEAQRFVSSIRSYRLKAEISARRHDGIYHQNLWRMTHSLDCCISHPVAD